MSMTQGKASVGHPVDVATGVLHTSYDDVSIPGKVPLDWERYYSTALVKQNSPLGIGWRNRYLCSLSYKAGEFRFLDANGGEILLKDPEQVLQQGDTVRNLGAFTELSFDNGQFVVCQWDVDTNDVWRYLFDFNPNSTGPKISALREIQDPTGQGLELKYDDTHTSRLIRIRQKLERRALQLSYCNSGLITAVEFVGTDGTRHTLCRYEHDANGCLVTATDAAGCSDRFDYNPAHCLVRESTKDGAVVSFRFDTRGRCVHTRGLNGYDEKSLHFIGNAGWTEVTDSLDNVTRFEWLPSGQVIAEVSPLGGMSKNQYDQHGRIIAQTAPDGSTVSFGYDVDGNRCKTTDPLGNEWWFDFNEHHKPIAITSPDGGIRKRNYNTGGQLIRTVDPYGNSWRLEYDVDGNVIKVIDPKGASVEFSYLDSGVLKNTRDGEGNLTHFLFDVFGRVSERRGPLNDITRIQYDILGNPLEITFPDNTSIKAEYDATGNIVAFRNGNGDTTTYSYGSCGRPMMRTDALGNTVRYIWGTEPGHLETLLNEKGEEYTFVYDPLGRVIEEIRFDGSKKALEYDLAGNCIAVTSGKNERIEYSRDAAGNVIELKLSGGSTACFAYDSLNKLISATNSSCSVSFERDLMGRVVKECQAEHFIEYRYDQIGCIEQKKTSLGLNISYEHDANGRMSAFSTNGGHSFSFTRNAYGDNTRRVLPGGAVLEQVYDPARKLIGQEVHNVCEGPTAYNSIYASQNTLVKRSYQYDNAGAVLKIEDGFWGKSDFQYDPVQRLVNATRERGTNEHFSYDSTNNITDFVTNQQERKLHYGPGNQLLSSGQTGYLYDSAGRLLEKEKISDNGDNGEKWLFSWDELDQLCSVKNPEGDVWKYEYDALGRRISKEGPNQKERFIWDGNAVIQHIWSNGSSSSWIYEPDSFLPLCTLQSGDVYSIITDHSGMPRELIDQKGQVVWLAGFRSWGDVDEQVIDKLDCPLRFAGQWFDGESGFHYNHFRYFDPRCGRYASQDPIGLLGSLNTYEYGPNPINWIDPYGLNGETCQQSGRQEVEDYANEVRNPRRGRPADVAVLTTRDGQSFRGRSGGTERAPMDWRTQQSLDSVAENRRRPAHGRCAEIDAINRAREAGADVRGATIRTARVRGAQAQDADQHGEPHTPCPSCQRVIDDSGITYTDQ